MRIPVALLLLLTGLSSHAQTTQGLISGRILDLRTRKPIGGARISYTSTVTDTGGSATSDRSGYYILPLLSPAQYRLRVAAGGYQDQELYELDLRVAARLEVIFRLRPLSDVWEKEQYRSMVLPDNESLVGFYGPDVDTSRSGSFEAARARNGVLESTISDVIEPAEVRELPLAGRDVYAALVLQPGVTADAGTSRGLGVSVNGQRPSASNYLLDGLENNQYLTTGPLTTVVPESIQEYRISTNNFSAEYGRTSGFIANAVTRSGGATWHGLGYFNLLNELLDANSFERNAQGLPRPPQKEQQLGFAAGGPLIANRLFQSAALDYLRSRSVLDPVTIALPTTSYINSLPAGSSARSLLNRYSPPPAGGNGTSALQEFAPPASVDRYVGLERLDYLSRDGTQRLMARVNVSNDSRPDFIWSPYKEFVSGLDQDSTSLALAAVTTLRPNLTNEARLGLSSGVLQWNRAHPEIPTLVSVQEGVLLPGSLAAYTYRNHGRNLEVVDNLLWARGRHVFKAGGGILVRQLDGYLDFESKGLFEFSNLSDFAASSPSAYMIAVDRAALPDRQIPDPSRTYRYSQYSVFVQDSFKATSRLAFNFGLRYENFGAPINIGAVKDAMVELGSGNSLAQSLRAAHIVYPGPGDRQVYASDNNNWAPRFGFSYSPRESGRTLLRGAYGIFYDRPFDNLWQTLSNNNFVYAAAQFTPAPLNYLASPASLVKTVGGLTATRDLPYLTLFQPRIRDGYAQNFFLGVQHQVTESFSLEINTTGSLGRKLITTDIVNRDLSLPAPPGELGRFAPDLSLINYRGNQGKSDYNALSVVSRYRGRHGQLQIAYTWSHSIDNQSDPLLNDLFNLGFVSFSSTSGDNRTAAYARQFDSQSDRGNSDFDQRHNLVFYSIWELPAAFRGSKAAALLRNWRVSQVAAFRSGFPFSVFAIPTALPDQGGIFEPARANLIDPAHVFLNTAIPGGRQLLNPAAFAPPGATLGNTGRNEFHGPGVYNIDLSLARSIKLPRLGESGRLTLRADAYNFLNHANLNSPGSSVLGFPGWGQANFGRVGENSSFPAATPFIETPRRIQLLVRVEF
jgi:hypothetical protein